MKQIKNKNIVILISFTLMVMAIFLFRNGFLGAKIDWINQHTVFPDYFRNLFYSTGNLFPNYAANLGAGQNIYNFSYYGLFNPIILFSYLLPFIDMTHYILATSMISIIASCLLFYKWIKSKGFNNVITLGVSCIFVLSVPIFYQSFKQITFINYMPFLIFSLIEIDRYFKNRKKSRLIISIFLMILSSFYFSISGLFVIVFYGFSVYLSQTEKLEIKSIAKSGIKFLIPIFTAILMSGILLIPTFASLLESNREKSATISLISLISPNFEMLKYLYHPYGIGLTSIILTMLLAGIIYKKRNEKFLSIGIIIFTIFPFFVYLLNGGLYIEDKVLIPFLPIIGLLLALFLQKLELNQNNFRKKALYFFIITIFLTLFFIKQTNLWIVGFADAIIMLFGYFIYQKYNKIFILIFPVIIILFITNIIVINPVNMVNNLTYQKIFNKDINYALSDLENNDFAKYRIDSLVNTNLNINRITLNNQYITSVYSSSYNKNYMNFRKNIFQLEKPNRNILMQSVSFDPLFLNFMGVKYIRSNFPPVGYTLLKKIGDIKIYQNNNVLPLAYSTSQIISQNDYLKIEYPYNQEILLHRAVIDKEITTINIFHSALEQIKLNFPLINSKNLTLTSSKGIYHIKAANDNLIRIDMGKPSQFDQVIFLKMNITNLKPLNDMSITIQNEENKLTASNHVYFNDNNIFHFAVSLNKGEKYLNIKLSKGEYEISSLQSFKLKSFDIIYKNVAETPFIINKNMTKGDIISGSINTKEDGYFITSIPYDENFKISVDGENISYEKVNTAFIGFPIKKGDHKIVFQYISAGFKIGALTSIVGLGIFILFISLEINSGIKKRNTKK